MAEIKAKMIRTVCPAGVSINYVGMCGDSHFAFPVSITLIKTMIERGMSVYEQIPPEEEGEDPTELLLTLENYDQDNGGEVVAEDANIVPDIELEVNTQHAKEREEFLTNKGLEIKEKQTQISNEFFGIDPEAEEEVTETTPQPSPTTPTTEPTPSSPTNPTTTDDSSSSSLSGGGSTSSIQGSGEDMIDEDIDN